jgi:hypothetical protein
MRILTFKTFFIAFLFLPIFNIKTLAQENKTTITQDPKFEQILNEKRKINSSITISDNYKIQVYNGESEIAKKTLAEFKRRYKNMDATIIFSTPTYKVWVGNYKTRIEAERNLMALKKQFPNALMIKPNK